ncbi:hypothetical protein PF002_g6937 [Phytophthora fragariae]|uniref:EF-hand domain-containing protein n=1 Tax=Phytophthora fragariae TaxID=53985 RepID=A0A6A3ZXZ1_9STRA|nr:hypothetical protein PF002_g6937 [Phytophthora fragariae]
MESLDRARALNALLALPRLECMLRVYRTWVNVEGVEGGMALTRRELQCVLEFPTQEQHVDFLFDTFRCVSAASKPRVDLLTLLTTAAALAQGALVDKARFVFALVDLDTEDDIVEAELALVISSCCSGLYRLGLIPDEDRVSEMDAMALAYEAFDFVELEDGDKMTFAMFLKWCVFHPRPKALLEKISCMFAACDAVKKMNEALQEHRERLEKVSLCHYDAMHFGSFDEGVEKVEVVGQVVPIQGLRDVRRVALLSVACLLELLVLKEHRVVRRAKAYRPAIFTLTELTPGCTYNLSFQGLLNEEFGILRTPHEHLPAFRLVVVSEDRFLDGATEEGASSELPSGRPWSFGCKLTHLTRGESGEMMQMWNQSLRAKNDATDSCHRTIIAELGATSWGLYPKEQARLLHLIFRKLEKHPRFHIVYVCSGAYASRTKIKEISTQHHFEQIVVGHISRSTLSSWSDQATTRIPSFADKNLSTYYSIEQEIPKGATKCQQYCVLDLVPHPLGASSDVKFYVQNHDEARLILGPVIGRVTPRTARILIELDRPVPNLVCTLTDPVTSQSYSSRTNVQSFAPTILKVEGLQPGTRYAINFEGLMESKGAGFGYVLTPAWVALISGWLVVNCNSMADFLAKQTPDPLASSPGHSSRWPRILANGLPSFSAQLAGDRSHRNGDYLGDHDDERQQNYNPWHSIEDEYLSEPLSSPQLLVHLGGQVDMSRAFTDDELRSLVVRLAKYMESGAYDEDSEDFHFLRSELRYRMQEVYRVAWGVPPMKQILGYCSNLMLLNEGADLYFSQSNVRSIIIKSKYGSVSDVTLTSVVATLRGIAFELWQLYQNQLWVDLAERELKYGSKSSGNKSAYSTTFGINRIVAANVSHEVEATNAEAKEPLANGDPGDPLIMQFTVPILLEINADARVVCVVTDILANQDVRVVQTLTRYHPQVFEIPALVPERRYVYRFEGIANSRSRRGSFHTPPSASAALNFLAVSSNFPEQMEETSDSLWAAIRKRVQVSWCGLDMILHLGGQVPMHEAAFECFEWARRELKHRGKDLMENEIDKLLTSLRRKVRQRLQQRYRLCWNIPNVRETLAHTSNWFLRSQADVAPFFRNHETLYTKAAQLVLAEAKQIVADYQLSLMLQDASTVPETTSELLTPRAEIPPDQPQVIVRDNNERDARISDSKVSESSKGKRLDGNEDSEANNQGHTEVESVDNSANGRIDTAQFIQTGEVGIFMCDMRSTPRDDVVSCNNRLITPLTQQERAVISEKQWMQLEKALKKKAVMVFVLCMELPLILSDAKYVDAMRENAGVSSIDPGQEEASGRWKLYDRQTMTQHWVSCRRQLEQLLNLLFRWKMKHRGRDVIVLSGGMRVGLETMLQDRDTKLSVRNLTVGPLTARVEPDFSDMPLAGTACPTFLGGAQRDERFTFTHSVIASKNYLLLHAVITREQSEQQGGAREASVAIKSASIETEFITDDGHVDTAHPVGRYRRFPAWWADYIPMGKVVFWDDTVMMRAQSDEDVTLLARYLQEGREFTAALEVLFEKHQFAEAARMEELRSKHRRRQRGPEELRSSLRAVFAELWKVLPESHRQRVAYFQDEFVFDFLLGYLAPELFDDDKAQEDERPPLEFAAFSTLCRDFIFNAGVLNLSLSMQQEDERRAIALQRAEALRQAAEREAQRIQQELQRAEDEAELERLQHEDPEEYAKRKLAEHEIAQQEKLAKAEAAREQRKAEKLRDVEEELAIAKEQRKLDKLAESGNDPHEFTRRRELLAARVRKFEERKRLREADEARRREKKEKKKLEKAAQRQQKETH